MIKLNDLAIGYNGEAILEHIDQEFDDGLIYGILAKSGAGKTTLLKTIAGLLRPVHDVTGAWHKEPFYKTEDRLPLGHGEKSVIILQSFIKLTRDEIFAIRWHMGSFDCAVKGGDYGMGNAFETCPLAVMTHLADMEATYLVECLAAK